MIQDYLYLIYYAKLFALGAVYADDLETMCKFATLLDGTLNKEMGLHRSYALRFDISEQELKVANPLPMENNC